MANAKPLSPHVRFSYMASSKLTLPRLASTSLSEDRLPRFSSWDFVHIRSFIIPGYILKAMK